MTLVGTLTNAAHRTAGSLIGLALGDALGASVEMWKAEEVAAAYPLGVRDFIHQPACGLRRGQGTDDTEMALIVARSLVAKRKLDLQDIAAQLVAWADGGGDAGPSTSHAIATLRRGVEPGQAGSHDTPSSGCLPRCAPVALAIPEHSIVPTTIACCELTHRHPGAIAASVAFNLILARLIGGIEWSEAVTTMENSGNESSPAKIIRELGGQSGAGMVVAEAAGCVTKARTAEEAIVAAVSAGGDTDTRGAVAGALSGARWGLEALPTRWIEGCDAGEDAYRLGLSLGRLRLEQKHRL